MFGDPSICFGLTSRAYKHEETLANPLSDTGGLSAQCTFFEGSQEVRSRFPFDLAECEP